MASRLGTFAGLGSGWGRRAAVTAGVSILAIGALHTPCARSLLRRAGGCPFAGAGMLTIAQAEVARHIALAAAGGTGTAPARPALGFMLDTTTLTEARSWASAHDLRCEEPHLGFLRCTNVPAEALSLPAEQGPVGELELEFNASGRLVNAETFRSHLSAGEAARTAGSVTASLAKTLGPPAKSTGGFNASHLTQPSAESIGTVSYRFGDYVVDVTAMHTPRSGVTVREQYMSARN